MSEWLVTARKAYALYMKGKTNPEIRKEIEVPSGWSVQNMIDSVAKLEWIESKRLSADEIALLISVANAQRRALERGDTCSPKLKYCGPWHWASGKAQRIARKRLNTLQHGKNDRSASTHFGLLEAYHGGYVRLTPSGWALVHALEAKEASHADQA